MPSSGRQPLYPKGETMNISEIAARDREVKRAELAATPLNMIDSEDAGCCQYPFRRAERNGALKAVAEWFCPKCGTEWRAKMVDGVRHWSAHVEVQFL